MYIRCWGSRGSIPVSGKKYAKYGGDTTCLEIRTKSNDIIIVDAGTGIRRLGNQMMKEGFTKFHLVFTHAHWDHVLGMPFFKPIYLPQSQFRILRCPFPSYVGKNQDRSDRQVDKMVRDARRILAEKGINMGCFAVGADMEFEV